MTGRISSAEVEELIVAVNQEEVPPKKKMEVIEEFLSRYKESIGADGRRALQEKLIQLSYL